MATSATTTTKAKYEMVYTTWERINSGGWYLTGLFDTLEQAHAKRDEVQRAAQQLLQRSDLFDTIEVESRTYLRDVRTGTLTLMSSGGVVDPTGIA